MAEIKNTAEVSLYPNGVFYAFTGSVFKSTQLFLLLFSSLAEFLVHYHSY
jgi:hypothetical protein